MKVTNIDWDTDGDKKLKASLPQEMEFVFYKLATKKATYLINNQ